MKITDIIFMVSGAWFFKEIIHTNFIQYRIKKRLKVNHVELWKNLNDDIAKISQWVSEDIIVTDKKLIKLRKTYRTRNLWFAMAVSSFFTSLLYNLILYW